MGQYIELVIILPYSVIFGRFGQSGLQKKNIQTAISMLLLCIYPPTKSLLATTVIWPDNWHSLSLLRNTVLNRESRTEGK